jgi:hypothetical protein
LLDANDVQATTLTMEELQDLLAKAKTTQQQDELADLLEATAIVAEPRRARPASPVASEISFRVASQVIQ